MRILFVYNANSNAMNRMVDFAHKILKPSTYKCQLCSLTHHTLGERLIWKAFKQQSNLKLDFYYIKKFEEEYILSYNYPVILVEENGDLEVIMSNNELNKIKDVEELISILEVKLMDLKNELL
tara:strand:- start:5521 stop:5889 length:369 start_codon:yes stop_codon:yes gene_type:complete